MKNKSYEICKGCQAICHHELKNYPMYKDFNGNITLICPCLDCLVKPICTSICDTYNKFEHKRNIKKGMNIIHPYRRIIKDGYVGITHLVKMKEKENE
jgi:hypothetical protein